MPKQSPSAGPLKDPQVARLLRDRHAVEQLLQSPDTKLLMELLARQGGLKGPAEAAMKGDPSALQGMLDRLRQDPKGAEVVERLSRSTPK